LGFVFSYLTTNAFVNKQLGFLIEVPPVGGDAYIFSYFKKAPPCTLEDVQRGNYFVGEY